LPFHLHDLHALLSDTTEPGIYKATHDMLLLSYKTEALSSVGECMVDEDKEAPQTFVSRVKSISGVLPTAK
jgi:hypothetical protein